MRFLYLYCEIILYVLTSVLFVIAFSRYRYHPEKEKKAERKRKTAPLALATFLGISSAAVLLVFFTWQKLYPQQPHHMGYFLAFFTGTILALFFFRSWLNKIDLKICFPSMVIVWILLLGFEAILLKNKAGWIYTDSTVLTITIGDVSFILENLVFFYLFSPFMSILIFTALAYNRSDITAFFLTNVIIWLTGVAWEYICMGIFKLWYMVEDRSILPINLFGARTTIEEMLYYVPFASISILIYLLLYYRKYRYLKTSPSEEEPYGSKLDKVRSDVSV